MSEEGRKALRYAYRLLSYRGRSELELAGRLQRKGFGPASVHEALGRLKEGGYLDDGALATSLRRKAEEVRMLGASGARLYMRQMGIPREVAEEALAGYDELASARRLIQRKMPAMGGRPEAVVRRRLAGLMRRRGYSAETVRRSLKFHSKETEG
jgi:regulatory protein